MKRISLFAVFVFAIVTTWPSTPAPATPPSYQLTCSVFGTPSPQMALYPVPGSGAPDKTNYLGLPARGASDANPDPASCGWVSRPYRGGEQLNLCGTPDPSILRPLQPGGTYFVSVYNDFKGCMVVTAVAPAPSQRSVPYGDATVVCHGPLKRGSAPASAFYHEEQGTLFADQAALSTNSYASLAPGACATFTGPPITTASFCVANIADTPVINQLQDLEHARFWQMTVHLDPGCHLYQPNSLQDLGTNPSVRTNIVGPRGVPKPSPSPSPAGLRGR